jgi:hypothetical protein
VLKLMRNPGGVFSIWLVPRIAAARGWSGTLAFRAGAALVAALLSLCIRIGAGTRRTTQA